MKKTSAKNIKSYRCKLKVHNTSIMSQHDLLACLRLRAIVFFKNRRLLRNYS